MLIDLTVLIAEICPSLNAASSADLTFWTSAELLQWADDAIKDAARQAQIFIAVEAISWLVTVPAPGLPQGAIAPLHVAFNGLPLTEATVYELEALDDFWASTGGPPGYWVVATLGTIRPYPTPPANGALSVIAQAFPNAISASQTLVEAPAFFYGYLMQAILGRARGKQSDAMMPEIAAHCAQREQMYRQLFAEYWGAGE